MTGRRAIAVPALAALLALAGSGAASEKREARPSGGAACPKAWSAGWQQLANRIRAPVYCPRWLPGPLTGEIGGPYSTVASVDERDRSYLVGFFLYDEGGVTHVNLRGYPGATAVPSCRTVELRAGEKFERKAPCFSKAEEVRRIGGITVTVYMHNRDSDSWHVLYAWRYRGSLYTLSDHVGYPWGYRKAEEDLDRMLRSLVLVAPRKGESG